MADSASTRSIKGAATRGPPFALDRARRRAIAQDPNQPQVPPETPQPTPPGQPEPVPQEAPPPQPDIDVPAPSQPTGPGAPGPAPAQPTG